MSEYLVTWAIDIDADGPEEAAARALIIQRDPESVALQFEVKDGEGVTISVDLIHRRSA